MISSPEAFLWGTSTAVHQVGGNNVNSDWRAIEGRMPGMERSGNAVDSYHRYAEDMQLLADAGLSAYRFGIEWGAGPPHRARARSHLPAALAHYRRMIDTAMRLNITPVVTLHHFTAPRWFAEEGGWMGEGVIERFRSYVTAAATILDGVEWVCTMNEPNMLALMTMLSRQAADSEPRQPWQSPTVDERSVPEYPTPDKAIGERLVQANHAAREVLRRETDTKIGWTVANRALVARPGAEAAKRTAEYLWEDLYLQADRDEDFIGVQSYSSQWVNQDGPEAHPPHPDNTLAGAGYRPDAMGLAVRHPSVVTGGVPILITQNGVATHDDGRRIAHTREALIHLAGAIADGIDVRGYLHWSLLDNFEWGHWDPTFGLIAVDRDTFARAPKPSLAWLGEIARAASTGTDLHSALAPALAVGVQERNQG